MRKFLLGISMGLACLLANPTTGQVTYTANNQIAPYSTEFMYGTNPGYYNSTWNDIALANIAKGNGTLGANVGSLRPTLPQAFLEQWGYGVRLREFNHYKNIGMKDHTVFLDITNNTKRDKTKYGGCTVESNLFQNMYTPIWDGGANGTPVNDNNYFALYVYKTVTTYKGLAKFWEIVNEPDFTYSTGVANAAPGVAGNWWQNAPTPCDLTNLRAPVFHYIRCLRIAYEVIKTVDPTSYVTLGGIGYTSFLDALLRYTDNPNNGSLTSEYPLKGGAYFDIVSYHSYPQYNLKRWNNSKGGFDYFRFSDAAADSVMGMKTKFESVLNKYGYNGATYPKKFFIITEYNTPRKAYTGKDWIGSEESQKNSMIKTLVKAQINDIKQMYVYTLGDKKDASTSVADGYDLMGLFYNLTTTQIGAQRLTPTGVGFKTTSTLLGGYRYDKVQTLLMKLPAAVEGAAFKNATGNFRYVLWARTKTDLSEIASVSYTFPIELGTVNATLYNWDYSSNSASKKNLSTISIPLTGSPVFLEKYTGALYREEGSLDGNETVMSAAAFSIYPNPTSGNFTISDGKLEGSVTLNIFNASGLLVQTEEINAIKGASIRFESNLDKGIYVVQLKSTTSTQTQKLIVE